MKTLQMGPMTTLKQRATRFGLGLGLAATLALSAAMPALADTPSAPGTLTLTGGSTVTATIAGFAFTGVTLTGVAGLTTEGAPQVTVVDSTGSSAGYGVGMTMTQFSGTGAASFTGAPRVTAGMFDYAQNTIPDYTTPIDLNDTTAVAIAGAAATQASNGTNVLSSTIAITIPADAQAGTVYSSTLTVSIVATP
jgi:hypothetical protein